MVTAPLRGQTKRKVIVDEDCLGPATTDLQAVLMFIQSPEVQTLGITVVSGDQWCNEEVAHALRLLEIIGRTDIPVARSAAFPLIRTKEEVKRWEKLYGKVVYKGAWNETHVEPSQAAADRRRDHEPFEVPPLPEGNPKTKPADEDAAHFIIRC